MSLKEKIRQLRSAPVPPNEESAKAQFIQPVLRLLGWPSDDPARVFFEYGAGSGRVDIALKSDGRFVAFIEAKAPGKNLEDHVSQMLQYAFYEGVDICVLTTGLEWWLYLPLEKGPPMARRFAVLDIGRGPAQEHADLLRRYLGRQALTDRSAEDSAKEALRRLREEQRLKTEIPKVWKRMTDGPDTELVELILKRVKEWTGLDAATSHIASVLGMDVAGPVHQPSASGPVSVPKPKGLPKATATPITAFRLWGKETPVTTWKSLLLGVVDALWSRHENTFLETVRPLWGKHRAWISTDKDDLREPRTIGKTNLHAETCLSAKAIERRCHRLLGAFGYPTSDLEILHG